MVFPGESFRKDHVLCEEKATKETVVGGESYKGDRGWRRKLQRRPWLEEKATKETVVRGERHRETMDIVYLHE